MGIIREGNDHEFRMARQGQGGQDRLGFPKIATMSPGSNTQLSERTLAKVSSLSKYGLGGSSGGADIRYSSPEIRNPLLNIVNFYLPYDRRTLNQWIRYYDRFQPMIGNALDMHGEFPMSDFRLTQIEDKEVLEFYEEQKERCNMVDYCFEASREYDLIGECFGFWAWNDRDGMWDEYVILNPDLLDIHEVNWGPARSMIYSYEPPQELKQLVHNQSDRVQDIMETIDPVVLERVMANERIPLDEKNVTSLIRRASPYDTRGTSIVLRAIKDLLYEDKLREVQYAIADHHITPVQLWKLGDVASGYMPTDEDLNNFRALLMAGAHDPLFTIVSHSAVSLELIGYTGSLLPVIPEFEWVEQRVMTALYTNKSMTSGEGPAVQAGAVVAMKVIQGRYQTKRTKIARQLRDKLFKPLAFAHEIYEPATPAQLSHRIRKSKKERKLMVPDIEWEFKLDLTDESQRVQFLAQLRQNFDLPMRTMCEILDLDYDKTKKYYKEEEGTVFDPVYRKARDQNAAQVAQAGGGLTGVGGAAMSPMGGGEEAGAAPPTPPATAPEPA